MSRRAQQRPSVTQPRSKPYRFIPLTQNKITTVDIRDYKFLSQWCWHALWNRHTKSFYAVRNIKLPNGKRTLIRMHRVILDCAKGEIGDHRNHDTLDNRRTNLRKCSLTQNHQNRKSNGAHFHKASGKWCAVIYFSKKKKHLGLFHSREDAVKAYNEAAKKYHGEFAWLAS